MINLWEDGCCCVMNIKKMCDDIKNGGRGNLGRARIMMIILYAMWGQDGQDRGEMVRLSGDIHMYLLFYMPCVYHGGGFFPL